MLEGFEKKSTIHTTRIITAENCLDFLTDDEKYELLENKTEIEYAAGETIIKQGFIASNIMYIEEGLAKLDIQNGKVISTVSLISQKSFVGIICTFASRNFDFSAVAIENTRVSIFDINLFKKFIHQNGSFAFHLIRHMSALTSEIVHHISKFAHKNIEGSLALLLLDFSNIYHSNYFTLPVSRIEIANMLGYSKESVINTLSKLNKEGILSVQEKKIEILDKSRLKQIGDMG